MGTHHHGTITVILGNKFAIPKNKEMRRILEINGWNREQRS